MNTVKVSESGRKDAGSQADSGHSEQVMEQVTAELRRIGDEVKSAGEKALLEAKNAGALSVDTKKAVDGMLVKQGELQARLNDAEQKLARRGNDELPVCKSVGQQVVEHEGIKAMMAAREGRARMGLKAITSVTSGADGSAGALVQAQRVQGIVVPSDRRMTVRDLLTPGSTNSNAIEYMRETGFTNNAAIQVAEGAAKAESTMKFDLQTTTVATIAHFVKASKQILDDAAMLASYIDGRLRYGLAYVEELQLLKGSGTGGNLNGIYTQASAYQAPFALAGATSIDMLRLALLQSELAELPATGIVLNPSDWTRIELTKTADGAYLFANPQSIAGPTLWGRPVVNTQAMDVDAFLVGAFRLGAQVFDREDASVQVSTEDGSNFTTNMVTIRAEERLGLAVYRPAAFIKGDFGLVK
ncbi:phage major capsid protein [Paraburkholderia bonniea]|uniref:phage major capsid protein n=1 Tax=Paraburkholderia bonniea TaxID=2152891 RepID=UPI0012919F4D|nr:phage major capsid protein [Paraburkholderia bonniea]